MKTASGVALALTSLLMVSTAYAEDYAPGSCSKFDKYNTRGAIVSLNSSNCDSIAPHLFGLRDDLYDYGMNLTAAPSFTYSYDMLGHDTTTQLYGGQNPQADLGGISLTLTKDLTSILPGEAQLTVRANAADSTFDSNNSGSPHYLSMSEFAVEEEFNEGQVQLIYGYSPQVYHFYGMVLGGNSSAAALGPSSVIPFETGMSAMIPTPSFTMKLKDNETHFYNTFSVTRSVHPDGMVTDAEKNTTGFNLKVHGAKALFLDEVGYDRKAGNGEKAVWVRLGGSYNTSHYSVVGSADKQKYNYSMYAAGTFQLIQPYGDARGLYFDVKFDYAPPSVNLYTSDVQLTAYYVGCFGRPDMFSVGFTRNFLSSSGVQRLRSETTDEVAGQSTALTVSYAAHLWNGVYLVPGVTYTRNPNITPRHKNALVGQVGLNFVI